MSAQTYETALTEIAEASNLAMARRIAQEALGARDACTIYLLRVDLEWLPRGMPVYVGATTAGLKSRMYAHRHNPTRLLAGISQACSVEVLEVAPLSSRAAREQHWYEVFSTRWVLLQRPPNASNKALPSSARREQEELANWLRSSLNGWASEAVGTSYNPVPTRKTPANAHERTL